MTSEQHLLRENNTMLPQHHPTLHCRQNPGSCLADVSDMHTIYEALKAVYGSSHQIKAPLSFSDGSIPFTDKEAILQCW